MEQELFSKDDLMQREEFMQDQMRRKGYVCPNNRFENPDWENTCITAMCNAAKCTHYGDDCIVYGKKNGFRR